MSQELASPEGPTPAVSPAMSPTTSSGGFDETDFEELPFQQPVMTLSVTAKVRPFFFFFFFYDWEHILKSASLRKGKERQ